VSDQFIIVIIILLYLKVAPLSANNTSTASKSRGVLVVDGYPSMGWWFVASREVVFATRQAIGKDKVHSLFIKMHVLDDRTAQVLGVWLLDAVG
jgi:hypothetical protein